MKLACDSSIELCYTDRPPEPAGGRFHSDRINNSELNLRPLKKCPQTPANAARVVCGYVVDEQR